MKIQAAGEALKEVKSGMVVGLGSGSTSAEFVKLLGKKIESGELKDIIGVPTSEATAGLAVECGIVLSTLNEHNEIDLAVDGADEVDPSRDLIKGLGRALLREKITEIHAKRFIVIVDETKLVSRLGEKCPLPVEITKFGDKATINWLNSIEGCRAELWMEDSELGGGAVGGPVVTDNGNYLVKCYFDGGIEDASALARELSLRPGVVEHGLFLGMADEVIIAGKEGVRKM